jgi:plastocyanin
MSTFWTHDSRRRGLGLGLSVLALLAIPATADAARVKGRLDGFRFLRNPVWAEAKDPTNHGYSFREPVPTVRSEFRRPFPHIPKELCVALLAAAPQAAPKPILIRVGGGRTTPVTIVVPPGTRLTFQNTDPFKHRLYGVGIKTFPAGEQGPGATREWTPSAPGTYEIRDEAAPSLRMWIVAEPTVASITYPSMKGEFSVNAETPGEYTLQAFFAGKKVGDAIPVKVDAADVEIKVPIKVMDQKTADAEEKASEKASAEKDAKAKGGK